MPWIRMIVTAALAATLAACATTPAPILVGSPRSNAVADWDRIAFDTLNAPPAPNGATAAERGAPNVMDLAIVHLAMYDAAMAVTGTHRPYALAPAQADPAASIDAAVVEAAYRTLAGLFPSRADKYQGAYRTAIDAIPAGTARERGQAHGARAAAAVLATREADGRDRPLPAWVSGTDPGQYRSDNPINRHLGGIRPLALPSYAAFRAPPPYALDSPAYRADLNEVRALAGTTSQLRSAEQSEIARFHSEPPNPFWARNLRRFAAAQPDLASAARMMAMLWTAEVEAIGACFETKYAYRFWRPMHAIRLGAIEPDPGWAPFLPTPNHPEYPAAHGCASAAVAQTLRRFYGTKSVAFEFDSMASSTTHRYESTDALVDEVANARVWGGMHFRTSNAAGAEIGRRVADWVAANRFTAMSR